MSLNIMLQGQARCVVIKSFAHEGKKSLGNQGSKWTSGWSRNQRSKSHSKAKALRTREFIYTA